MYDPQIIEKKTFMQLLFSFFSNPAFYSLIFCNICCTRPPHPLLLALILVMAADSFTLALKAEKNFCRDNAQIERSLLPAFQRVKRACIGDRPIVCRVAHRRGRSQSASFVRCLLSAEAPPKARLYYLRDELPAIIHLPERTIWRKRKKKNETDLTVGTLGVIKLPSPGQVPGVGFSPRAQVIGGAAQGSSNTPGAIVEAWERLGEGRVRW